EPGAAVRLDGCEEMIGAALSGQGGGMGIGRLVSGLSEKGRLVAPFGKSLEGQRAYYVIRSSVTGGRPHVEAFVDWLVGEAKVVLGQDRLSSPPPAAKSAAARPRARSPRCFVPFADCRHRECSRRSWSDRRNRTAG